MTSRPAPTLAIATNNGDVGGGEIMLLALANAARELGVDVTVIAPSRPSELLAAAREQGFAAVEVAATSRLEWMVGLRRWDDVQRTGIMWCNGLVPALATAGRRGRVVHLHQLPTGAHRAAATIATRGAQAVLAPSRFVADRLPNAAVLENWTADVPVSRTPSVGPQRIGFLGRHSLDKGLAVLAEAIALMEAQRPGEQRLVLAGEPRFASHDERDQIEAALAPIEHLIDRLGWVTPSTFFSQVDVAAFPSLAPESFGLVVAEAMASRTRFVISDAGALPEVAGAHHPLVVPRGDAPALAAALHTAPDVLTRSHLADARARWLEHYSPKAGRRSLARVLRRLGILTEEIRRA